MSPIDQAFLKAFANAGRPSVVAAPASPPAGAAALAHAPKPAAAPHARPHDSEAIARPVVPVASNAPTVSPPRITLSEAIALRESLQSAVESPVESAMQWEAGSAPETLATATVEGRPLAPESRTAQPLPPNPNAPPPTAPAMFAIETAFATEHGDAANILVESARPTTIAHENTTGEPCPTSRRPDRSVAEAIAARLAQLTARWDATAAQGHAAVAEPLPTDTALGPSLCLPAVHDSSERNDNVAGEAFEHSPLHPDAGPAQTLTAARPCLDDDPCARVAFARDEEAGQANRAGSWPEAEPLANTQSLAEAQLPVEPAIAAVAHDHAAETAPILRLLRPAIQLERFAWPSLVSRWMRGCGEQLDGVVDALLRAVRTEQRIIGFSSCRPGEGVSSVVLATARRLSQRRCRFAVLEGNWDAPQFAHRLALLGNDGWEAVIEGRRDLPDVMVGADEGRAAVVPAMRAPAGRADPARIAETYDLLRQNYEIVLVDLPPRGQGAQCLGPLCDSIVLVQHPRQTRLGELQKYADQWSPVGVGVLGVVQNGSN